ncbi:MAG: bifunctional tRNA (5-methylaminomethyl-2-thiouridine)(34)-methyltransferase MnmD/FAD-dependent 5-carboxymethylaminomethyl-2-thiouridine(34) oxidoreductase MnmC [Betaproteobacteria bacterium]|nr:bifunctional tRNA (5-methylaminomethyl-2-thiouridine)(34)-methyltransferase MnmD/FAD-dependent 5-carboxymethylaminomethyl-2-thiouridine(34) oxidoreductase MnmC [Betaproteobacteria bacterium]
MRSHIVPATLAYDVNGTPYSPEYGDVYHSAESGPGQARHVFLGGNDLPGRWAGTRIFTIVETGFGLGLNFLATWQAWRADPARPERLHFVSVEKHPFTREGLALLHARYPELAPLAQQLQAAWPPLLPGLHRLHFEDGRVTLTLAFANVADIATKLRLAADAFYLDGFAPDRNPDMWAAAVMKALARLARPGATAATYTTARAVRDALAAAGFAAALRPGFGRKRDMLAARYAPLRPPRDAPSAAPQWGERRAIVIGAGLAGAAVAERLTSRGWAVELIERRPAPAAEASGIPAGVFHPHVSRDDSLLSRLTRAGFLLALNRWRALEAAGHRLGWARCGVLQIAKDGGDEARMAAAARALGLPPEYLEYLPRATARARAGCDTRAGGWWFPEGGWMQPASLINAQLAAAARGSRLVNHLGRVVQTLDLRDDRWEARGPDGSVIASAPVMVLANSHDAARLARLDAPLKQVRGQLTCLPADGQPLPRAVLAGPGHLIPLADGAAVVGATYDFDDDDPEPREEGHAGNLARLEKLQVGNHPALDPARLNGSVGFRCVAADRLPLIGNLPDLSVARAGVQARRLPRQAGLYGAFAYASRGLTWAALGGELISSMIDGEPLPVEGDLADAINPGRFALRRARRGKN